MPNFPANLREDRFGVVVEFTPHSAGDVRKIAGIGRDLLSLNRELSETGIQFTGVFLTQNPGGNLSYDHAAAVSLLRGNGFPEELEIVPHITGKDMNADAVRALLAALLEAGIGTVLALTGDAPLKALGVFELDSLGVLEAIQRFNVSRLRRARSEEELLRLPLLVPGAAVSPFKYTRASWEMQLIKAQKKVQAGARFLVCQSGWDPAKSEDLIRALGSAPAAGKARVPVLGNAIVVNEIAARFMRELPGCVVTDAFLDRLHAERAADQLRRAGRQMAMFRQLGYAGVDLSKPGDFDSVQPIAEIVHTALETEDWHEVAEDISFPPTRGWNRVPRERPAAFSKWVHRTVLAKDAPLHSLARRLLAPVDRSAERNGLLYRFFKSREAGFKELVYECEHCGDCYLPENEYLCTLGGCSKGLANPPCGDADPEGRCGNDASRLCVGERLYHRLRQSDRLDAYRSKIYPPRDPALRGTASLLNWFFERDHAGRKDPLAASGLIQIGELLHASIPASGAAMRALGKLGDAGFSTPNRGRAVVCDIIRSQAEQGAHYLDVNIDELAEADAPAMMRRYIRLIREFGRGVPPCIDSSDPAVLEAGLHEWFEGGTNSNIAAPLVNSIPFSEKERYGAILALRRRFSFSTVILLVGPEGPMNSTDEMVNAAREMFRLAREAGFAPCQLFFDTVTLGIATDGCIGADGGLKPSHTRNSFHAIQRIRNDPEMRGCHAVLGVSNWVFGARKRRIGHIRAFIHVGVQYGLDAVICDVAKGFGLRPAARELVEFVEMFVGLDGSDDSMMRYAEKMQEMREKEWV